MKKIISVIAAAVILTASFPKVYAENIQLIRYYSTEEMITVYTAERLSEQITARISGVTCDAENLGDIYHNADKYETIFLIDSSKSMKNFSDEINTFLAECIDKKRENEYYSIGIFSSKNMPEYIIADENDQYALEKSLDKLSYEFDSTYIYDNLINTIENLNSSDEPIYRRIVLITDGNENSARGITIDDVTEKLTSDPVPVYTVTLQNSQKTNIENLKNIARLSRKSNASEMRIVDGGDAVKPASVLSESAQKTQCISIIPDSSLLDGSVKALEISDGSSSLTCDIRLAMAEATESQTELTEVSEPDTETEITSVETAPERQPSKLGPKIIIAIAAAAAAVVCIIIIIIFLVKDKKKKSASASTVPLANNDDTMIISGRSGQTEILIDDDRSSVNTVILRDSVNSVRTFEAALSGEGAIIGRSSDFSNVVIDYDKSVSRKHCRIFLKNGQVHIEDLSSGNKTYLNGVEVTSPTVLNNTDEIKIGRTKLKVTLK